MFALCFPVPLAVAATAVVHVANNLFKFGMMAKQADWQVVARFGIPAGSAAFTKRVARYSARREPQRLTVRCECDSPLGHWALTDSCPSADVTLILLRVADLVAALLDGRFCVSCVCSCEACLVWTRNQAVSSDERRAHSSSAPVHSSPLLRQ
ncbi:MAG: hypothetical protein MRJ92_10480 [Nitrospira sp.]|nr:hypothetical protein [Nitrospira sp.]